MAAPGKTGSEYKHSDQERDNKSHDDTYGLNAVIPVGEYSGAVYRLQVDSSGNLKVTSTGGGGDATAANQVTGNATLSSIDTKLTDKSQFTKITDGTDTALVTASGEQNVLETNSAAIKTAVETIDNAISGSEMQVDVVGALPAGTNAIGKLAANSGVDIGDVDVTSTVLPAGAATSSVTSVADTTTSATLKASNSSRKQIIIQNTSSAILYVKYGATATSSDFTVLLNQNDILIEDRYTGIIDGIWATDPGNGAAKITEIT